MMKHAPTHWNAWGFLAAAVLFFAVVLPGTVHGAEFISGGANFVPDFETEVTGSASTASGIFDLKTGFRATVGYEFIVNDLMSVEIESGFLYNEIDNEGIDEFEAWYGQLPALVNLVFHYEFQSGWTPFIGVGGGVTVGILDL